MLEKYNYIGYTYCLCKECGKLFPYYSFDEKIDTPPDSKLCKKCLKKKNLTASDFLKHFNVKNSLVKREFKKILYKEDKEPYLGALTKAVKNAKLIEENCLEVEFKTKEVKHGRFKKR